MGIRYEKDSILNWINEMGKFLRLLVSKWEGELLEDEELNIAAAYKEFFLNERSIIVNKTFEELIEFANLLESEQIRPLALLLMYDGLLNNDKSILLKSKRLFEYHMKTSGLFSFDDYGHLEKLETALNN